MASGIPTLKEQFENFAKFGDTRADGTIITLTSIDKWLKQAGVFCKALTTTDTAITFNKFKSKVISYEDFVKFVEDLAGQKRIPVDQIMEKLQTCGPPGTTKATQPLKTGAVERLTDTSKYTGSHRERFDEEGKGRGIEGREYIADDSGYVTGYKGQGTYDNHNTTSLKLHYCQNPQSHIYIISHMAGSNIPLDQQFTNFAKFGDTKADGKTITLSQIDKWMKQAAVFDKSLTTTDTAICFNKFKSKVISYQDFVKFIEDLAGQKKIPSDKIKEKMENCGLPGTNKATQAVKTGAVDRLTDTSKYTGSHKERFDESGKGKGAAGRADLHDDTGYVGGYKGQGTYDKK